MKIFDFNIYFDDKFLYIVRDHLEFKIVRSAIHRSIYFTSTPSFGKMTIHVGSAMELNLSLDTENFKTIKNYIYNNSYELEPGNNIVFKNANIIRHGKLIKKHVLSEELNINQWLVEWNDETRTLVLEEDLTPQFTR